MGHGSREGQRGDVARLVGLLVALVVAGCGSSAPPPSCTPGAQLACACPGGASSVQVCGASGVLGFCACPDGGALDVVALDAPVADVPTLDAPAVVDVTDAGPVDAPPSLPDGCASTTAGNCCGVACPAVANGSPACLGGACGVGTCAPGFGDCNRLAADGCEVELATTAAHCGACGAACSSDRTCVGSSCVACPALRTACAGVCVDTQRDPANCGGCNAPCDARPNAVTTCTAGGCRFTCAAGFADCNGDPADGCESGNNDTRNCGTCGNNCPAGVLCIDRQCGCPAGRAECDGNAATVCETNTATGDIANCGGCGVRCPTPPVGAIATCAAGRCGLALACSSDRRDCNMNAADGCETTILTDVNRCGGCGNVCSATGGTPSCTGGACRITCSVGLGNCDGAVTNGCETNTNTSVAHCGACGRVCSLPRVVTQACVAGACTVPVGGCAVGLGNCDGVASNGCESSLSTDTSNCGACGNVCPARPGGTIACASGVCRTTCSPGRADCDTTSSNGCEADLSSDSNNCGGCGTVCSGGTVCRAGVCAP